MEKVNIQFTGGYFIVENGIARKVTKEEFEEHEKYNREHKIGELVLVEGEDDGKAD
jgi:hypothetical protein